MTAEAPADRVLKVADVARWLDCSVGQIYTLAASGALRTFKVGRLLRVRESAVLEFMKAGES